MISNGAAIQAAIAAFLAGFAIAAALYHRPKDHPETMGREWGEIDRAATDAYEAVQAIVHQAITDIRVQRAAAEIGYARQMTLPEAEAAMPATFEAAYGWPYDQERAEPKEYRVGDPYP